MKKTAIITLLLASAVLLPHLLGQKIFVFVDVGQDFLLNIWPMYKHFGDLIKSELFPTYTLSLGFGTNIFAGSLIRTSIVDPFAWILYFTPNKLFAYLIPYVFLIKITLAGSFFSYFLHRLGIDKKSSTVGGLLFAFSSQMLVRSGWYHYTTEMVFIPLFLVSIKEFLDTKKKIGLILSFLWLSTYHSYYALVYLIFGSLAFSHIYFQQSKINLISFIKKIKNFWIACFSGILAGSVIFIPNIYNILSSSREIGNNNYIFDWKNLFVSKHLFLTIISRFYSSELLGYAKTFSGWTNTLEAPILSLGIFSLIILFIVPFFLNKKEKIIFYISYLIVFLYLLVPGFTQLINGFYGSNFKTSAFFITVLTTYYVSYTLTKVGITNRIKNVNPLKILLASSIPLVIFIFYTGCVLLFESEVYLQKRVWFISLLFLLVYPVLFFLKFKLNSKKIIPKMILILIILEIFIGGYFTLHKRTTLTKDQVENIDRKTEKLSKIVDKIKDNDKGFYRIEKDFGIYGDGYPNDSAVVGYMDTGIYHSFNHSSFSSFMKSMGLLDGSFSYRFFSGFSDEDISLRRLLGVKYFLSKNDKSIPEYVQIDQYENVLIWEDKNVINFGTVFTEFITYDQASSIDKKQIKETILNKIIVPNNFTSLSTGKNSDSNDHVKEYSLVTSIKNNEINGKINVTKPGIIFFPITYDKGWNLIVNNSKIEKIKVNYGFVGAFLGEGEYIYQLKYEQPYLRIGGLISIISIAILFIHKKHD